MKKQIMLGVSLALILVTLISGISLAASPSLSVSKAAAEKAALDLIQRFDDKMISWTKDSIVGEPVIYYAPDGNKSAYEYPVQTNGKDAGFILVSARKDWEPVLEFSDGTPPSSYVTDAESVAKEMGYVLADEKSTPMLYYFGAFSFAVQFGDGMKDSNDAIHLTTGNTIKISDSSPQLKMDPVKAQKNWGDILGQESVSLLSKLSNSIFGKSTAEASVDISVTQLEKRLLGYGEISGVPAFYQERYVWGHGDDRSFFADDYPDCVGYADDPWDDWDGCAPIAGAMVLGYWSEHGYPNIPDPDLGETEDTLIDHCHKFMGTNYDGETSTNMVAQGIEDLANDDEYGFDYDFTCDDTYDYLYLVENEIDADRPCAMSMEDFEMEEDFNHTVCVYGYSDTIYGAYLHIWNTWNTNDYYIAWNDWSDAYIHRVFPGS
jgi:hypothetical protein